MNTHESKLLDLVDFIGLWEITETQNSHQFITKVWYKILYYFKSYIRLTPFIVSKLIHLIVYGFVPSQRGCIQKLW